MSFKMANKKPTQEQLRNLAKGREKLFQNQLKQKGINLNPRPQIIREVVRQPVVNHNTTHQHNLNVQLSLFNKFLETKFFPIEFSEGKQNLNIKQTLNYLLNKTNNHTNAIISNQNKISEIITNINYKDKENEKKFKHLENKISTLEKENEQLKKEIAEKNGE